MRKDSLDGTTAAAQAAAAWMVETASDSVSHLPDTVRDKSAHLSHITHTDGSFREKADSNSRPVSRAAE